MTHTPHNTSYMDTLLNLGKMYYHLWQDATKVSDEADHFLQFNRTFSILNNLTLKLLEDPKTLVKHQLDLATGYIKIWGNILERYNKDKQHPQEAPLYQPSPKDKRFKDHAWGENFIFDFIKQSYLLTAQSIEQQVLQLKGVDKKTLKLFDFYTKQFFDALSPTNFAFTNPEVIRATLETKGANLIKGFENLIADMEKSHGLFHIKTTDFAAFTLGKNLAATPGKVIYRNDLIELIHYTPATTHTYTRPLLIVPAWINKYYILDLSLHNSFVQWVLDKGYAVFMISWVNPDKKHKLKSFQDYMVEGPLAAIDAIEQATGQKDITALGYCLGGTLLTCTLAYMQANNDTRIKAASYLTTMVDFSEAGDLQLFIDETLLKKLDQSLETTGYFKGSEMVTAFSVIRANDLIWSFVVNNYLLGKEPFPFDILYWNADATRLTPTSHRYYLQHTYIHNDLVKPGKIHLQHIPIHIEKITTPSYLLAAKEDHIAPWETCYKTTQLLAGPTTFVLTASGHVAGVINPPDKKKYSYYTNTPYPSHAKEWLSGAKEHKGSWWEHWEMWQRQHSGETIPALQPGSGKLPVLEDAPGSYVKVHSL